MTLYLGNQKSGQAEIFRTYLRVYAPTTTHKESEVEQFYNEVKQALSENTSNFQCMYKILMGDFNAKIN
jgi:Fe-S oxidoreductase